MPCASLVSSYSYCLQSKHIWCMHRNMTVLTWLAHACFDCQHAILLSTAVMLQLSQPLHQQRLVQNGFCSTNISCCDVSLLSTMAAFVPVKVVSSFEGMCGFDYTFCCCQEALVRAARLTSRRGTNSMTWPRKSMHASLAKLWA